MQTGYDSGKVKVAVPIPSELIKAGKDHLSPPQAPSCRNSGHVIASRRNALHNKIRPKSDSSISLGHNVTASYWAGVAEGSVTSGVRGGVTSGVRGGVTSGVRGGVTSGVRGEVTSGVRGGVTSVVGGGVTSSVRGGVTSGVRGGVTSGVVGGVTSGVRGGSVSELAGRVSPDVRWDGSKRSLPMVPLITQNTSSNSCTGSTVPTRDGHRFIRPKLTEVRAMARSFDEGGAIAMRKEPHDHPCKSLCGVGVDHSAARDRRKAESFSASMSPISTPRITVLDTAEPLPGREHSSASKLVRGVGDFGSGGMAALMNRVAQLRGLHGSSKDSCAIYYHFQLFFFFFHFIYCYFYGRVAVGGGCFPKVLKCPPILKCKSQRF